MKTLVFDSALNVHAGSGVSHHALFARGQPPSPTRRRLPWLTVAALLAIVCLLASFHYVVRDAVRRGDVWRHATALHGVAAMHCNVLQGGRLARESCLVRLNTSLLDDASPHEDGAATVAQRGD